MIHVDFTCNVCADTGVDFDDHDQPVYCGCSTDTVRRINDHGYLPAFLVEGAAWVLIPIGIGRFVHALRDDHGFWRRWPTLRHAAAWLENPT